MLTKEHDPNSVEKTNHSANVTRDSSHSNSMINRVGGSLKRKFDQKLSEIGTAAVNATSSLATSVVGGPRGPPAPPRGPPRARGRPRAPPRPAAAAG